MNRDKILLSILTYNHEKIIRETLNRIPDAVLTEVDILISDDGSSDKTLEALENSIAEIKFQKTNITILRNEKNIGYGGNQKRTYNFAIKQGYRNYVIMLHGDGQYNPKYIEQFIEIIKTDSNVSDKITGMIFGSRMQRKTMAIKGKMPLYKFFGNIILTSIQNFITGQKLTEWHSGFRSYNLKFLKESHFNNFSDGFDFDTQIILDVIEQRYQIVEFPIETFYGEEISAVNSLNYGLKILMHTLKWKTRKNVY